IPKLQAQTLPGVSSMKSMQYPSAGPSGRSQVASRNSSGAPMIDPAKKTPYDPLIGRKVMTRWPEDNNFYEAVITDYNPVEKLVSTDSSSSIGKSQSTKIVPSREVDEREGFNIWFGIPYHNGIPISCRYNAYRPIPSISTHGTLRYHTISPDDIRWEGGDPGVNHRPGQGGVKRSTGRGGGIPGAGRGRGTMKNQAKKQFPPAQNGIGKKRAGDIEILHTETVIKEVCILRIHGTLPTVLSFDRIFMEHCQLFRHLTAYFSHISLSCSNQVEKVFGASHPDPLEIEKAKKLLKVGKTLPPEEGEHQFPHQQQSMKWGNRRQYGGNHQGDKYRGDDVTAGGGREGSDGDHLVGHGDHDDP
ncbi:hypothetical protein B296_00006456, partial [Ensete ventricosum]